MTLRRLYERAGLRVDEVICHDDIYNSNMILPWLHPFVMRTRQYGGSLGFCLRVLRGFVLRVNSLLVNPVLTRDRRAGEGGIITVVGVKM